MRFFHLFLLIASVSCTSVYQPGSVMTPLLEDKGDLEVQATFRMGDMIGDLSSIPSGATVNIGTAYAFTSKYALITNIEYQNEYSKNDPSSVSTESELRKGLLGEFFLGRYFSNRGFSNTSVFLGFGKGRRNIDFVEYWHENTASYQSDYLKTSLLFQHAFREKWKRDDERLVMTLFGRINYIHNYNVKFHSSNDYYLIEHQRFDGFFTLEPGMNIALVYKWLSPFLQFNFTYCPLHNPHDYATNAHIALGARIKFQNSK